MKTAIKIVPSKLELAVECPAAPARNVPFPFEPNEASERGQKLHELTAMVIEAGMDELDDLCSELNETDKQAVKTCAEVAQMLMPAGKRIRFVEEKMDLKFLSMTSGKPDLAYYDVESKTIAVVDWKFGRGQVPDPSGNRQLQAYVLALTKVLTGQGFGVLQAYLVICQPCGTPKESYRDANYPAQIFPTWEKEIKDAIAAAQKEDAVAIPGPHCKRSFCEAGKHGVCPEFKAYSGEIEDAKEEKAQKSAAFAVSGFNPIVVTAELPAMPLVVLSVEAVAKAEDYRTRSLVPVTDQASADSMGLLLGEITKFESQVEKNRVTVKKPFLDMGKLVDDAAKQALIPLAEGKETAKRNLGVWMQAESKRQAKIQADYQAKQKELEDKKAAGEEVEEISIPVPTVAPIKIAGVSTKKVPEFTVPDITKVPAMFLQVNEALLKKAIETKSVTEKDTWVEIRWVDKAQSSAGRR